MVVPAVLLRRGSDWGVPPFKLDKQQQQQQQQQQEGVTQVGLPSSEAASKPGKQHGSDQIEDDTHEQLRRVQLSLQRKRPKYVTHFRQHKVGCGMVLLGPWLVSSACCKCRKQRQTLQSRVVKFGVQFLIKRIFPLRSAVRQNLLAMCQRHMKACIGWE